MRTTIEISDEIMRQAKKKAADEGTPLRHVVEQALRLYLPSLLLAAATGCDGEPNADVFYCPVCGWTTGNRFLT